MKYILALLLLIFTLNIYSQQDHNYTDENGLKQGPWHYKDTVRNAFINCNYKDDVLHGDYYVVSTNEYLLYKVHYVDGKKIGDERTFLSKNRLIELAYYDNKGELFLRFKFHTNGSLWEEIEYKNGVKHGWYREYRSNGTLFIEQEFVDGVNHGEEIHYNKKGRPKLIIVYEKGVVKSMDKY